MFTLSYIFLGLMSSTFASDLYGFIRRILYLIFVGPYCKFTMPLENTALSQMGPYMAFHICM